MVPSLEGLETIHLNGLRLEAFTTSGSRTMLRPGPETLNYKTMRYPGHCDRTRFFLHEPMHREPVRKGRILVECPPVQEDVVYVHVRRRLAVRRSTAKSLSGSIHRKK